MKAKILYLLICSLSLYLSCCSLLFPDEKLSMQREDFTGNELRMDGYYYCQKENVPDPTTSCIFMYRNGTILSAYGHSTLDLDVVEKEIVDNYYNFGKDKWDWGVFIITNNRIEYEQWIVPSESISTRKSTGNIENDTTFYITEQYFSYNKKKYSVNEVWHFKHFVNKPDSTNNYIK